MPKPITYETKFDELMDTVSLLSKSKHYNEIRRLIETAYILEDKLKSGPVAIHPESIGVTHHRYKSLKFEVHDWIRKAGQSSIDFPSPLEAMKYDG